MVAHIILLEQPLIHRMVPLDMVLHQMQLRMELHQADLLPLALIHPSFKEQELLVLLHLTLK